ncbi:MAG: PEGA domain-containing protein [Polyangiaceae bacterium]|nr:PEGA domain-containing protein [Polyangiaceae bacterium]
MWHLRGTWVLGLGFIVLTTMFARPAAADAVTAEALFQQGREAMQDQDYETACARFAESNRLDTAAGTLMNLATCEEKLGRVASAWQHWREAIDLLPADDNRIGFARQRLTELKPRLPGLTLVPPPDAPPEMVVLRDGVELGEAGLGVELPVDPGSHEIVVRAKGYEDWSTEFSLAERETQTIALEVGPEAPEPPPTSPSRGQPAPEAEDWMKSQRTWGYIAGGVGVAGALTGVGSFLAMRHADAKARNHCDAETLRCDPDGMDALDSGKTWSLVNYVGWGVAVAGLGVGAFLVISDLESEAPQSVGLAPLPAGAALSYRGRF